MGVIAHGSIIKEEDVEAIKKPVLFLYSDNDRQIPTELREKFQAILKTKSFPTEGVFYPGQVRSLPLKSSPPTAFVQNFGARHYPSLPAYASSSTF